MSERASVKNYFVYQYHHIDDLSAIIKPENMYRWFGTNQAAEEQKKLEETVDEVGKLFFDNGWEGDGQIGMIWIPPFIDIGYDEDTWGSYLWHVKQNNNGTSFIASPVPLRLK